MPRPSALPDTPTGFPWVNLWVLLAGVFSSKSSCGLFFAPTFPQPPPQYTGNHLGHKDSACQGAPSSNYFLSPGILGLTFAASVSSSIKWS